MIMPRKSGFTLLELLVVIAIIAVVALLLFTGGKGMIAKADTTRCSQNLRQIGAAGILYANDRGGRLPDRTAWSATATADRAISILPYLDIPSGQPTAFYQKASVFTCPAAQRHAPTEASLFRTYAINQWAAGSSSGELSSWTSTVLNRNAPLRLQNAQPAQQAFFMDGPSATDANGTRYSVYQRPDRIDYRESTNWRTLYIHEGMMVVFLDGHVERITKSVADQDLIGLTNGTPSPRVHPFWGAGN